MLRTRIESLEKTLEPLNPRILGPFLATFLEKNLLR